MRRGVDRKNLPAGFPTHKHGAEFWEALGRTVATFGYLEAILGKAIFAFTAMRQIHEDNVEAELERWLVTLKRALDDPLGDLINAYGKAVREHGGATIKNLDALLGNLREVSTVRNVLCHGSWLSAPNNQGQSVPLYVDKKSGVFHTPIDIAYLEQVQQYAAELSFDVIDTVTHMGWQFPGSSGPGNPI